MSLNVAVVHNHFPLMGGSERVAVRIARLFEAPLFTLYSEKNLQEKLNNVIPLIRGDFHGLCQIPPFEQIYPRLKFKKYDIRDYDVIVSSGNWSKMLVSGICGEGQKHIHYCHGFPRVFYESVNNQSESVRDLALHLWYKLFRFWDLKSSHNPTEIVVNSKYTGKNVIKYWKRKPELVYPPVNVNKFRNQDDHNGEEYFLTVGRLGPQKRVRWLIKAFRGLDKKLIIAGDGPERCFLENLAKGYSNIEFYGWVKGREMVRLYKSAVATLYVSKKEPFGIVPVESMATGTPVIGVREGGIKETVNKKTGILFEPSNSEAENIKKIRRIVKNFDRSEYNSEELRRRAKDFNVNRFEKEIRSVVEEI